MFQRGRKIIVLESSARSGIHPQVGDVGYLDNMYLFPNYRLILLNAFFFKYRNSDNERVEKKKFIIDLGMNKSFRFVVSHKGVPIEHFIDDGDFVNLSPVGYHIAKNVNGRYLISYPELYSNYGIWPNVDKKLKLKGTKNKSVKIPYGQIALFNTKSTHKYPMTECSNAEFTAWFRSMIPIIGSITGIYCNYREIFLADPIKDGYFSIAQDIWNLVKDILKVNYVPEHANLGSTYHIDKDALLGLEKIHKSGIIKYINELNSSTFIFLQRLDLYHLNRYLEGRNLRGKIDMRKIDIVGRIERPLLEDPFDPFPAHVYDLARSIFFRTIIMPNSTNNMRSRLESLKQYLPANLQVSRAMFDRCIKIFEDIKAKADSDSSALNRIYEVI